MNEHMAIPVEMPISPDAPPKACVCGGDRFKRSGFRAEDIYRCERCGRDWQNRIER